MTPTVAIHLAAVVPALAIGAVMLALRKGTGAHRLLGRLWAGLMLIGAVSSLWIRNDGHFSGVHLLSLWVLFSLAMAIYSIRGGNVRRHQGFMVGTYIGLIVAGTLAALPGRTVGNFLFG